MLCDMGNQTSDVTTKQQTQSRGGEHRSEHTGKKTQNLVSANLCTFHCIGTKAQAPEATGAGTDPSTSPVLFAGSTVPAKEFSGSSRTRTVFRTIDVPEQRTVPEVSLTSEEVTAGTGPGFHYHWFTRLPVEPHPCPPTVGVCG